MFYGRFFISMITCRMATIAMIAAKPAMAGMKYVSATDG
jgi:hypothetical protein